MSIYLDLVILLNFLVDLLLLLGTNRLSGFPMEPVRCAAAAALGGAYSGACLLKSFRFLGGLVWRLVFLVLISLLAFGLNCATRKRCGIFLILSMALGGMALSLNNGNFLTLTAAAAGVYMLCRLVFGTTISSQEYVPVTIDYRDRTVSLIALRDTGNTLKDPVSGESVFLISAAAAGRLTGLPREALKQPLETLEMGALPGLRLIPYRAVGTSCGMLLALRVDHVKVDGVCRSAIVAFSPEELGTGTEYQALIGV